MWKVLQKALAFKCKIDIWKQFTQEGLKKFQKIQQLV
jgi:hypothetical protein